MSDILKAVDTNINKIKFDKFEDGKKGAVSFRTPLFIAGTAISEKEQEDATELAAGLRYKPANTETNDDNDEIIPF